MKADDQAKTALNGQTKAALRADLRAKTWVQKVDAIARLNKATKLAREAMRRRSQTAAEFDPDHDLPPE